MRNQLLKLLPVASLLLIGLVPCALADDLSLQQSPAQGAVMGGVYTSPYTIVVNGTPELLICDDFTTDITMGQEWGASVSTFTSTSSSIAGLKFDQTAYNTTLGIWGSAPGTTPSATTIANDYAIEAVLAAELMSLPDIGTPLESDATKVVAGELSYAIWSVFDLSLYKSLTDPSTLGYTSFGYLASDNAPGPANQPLVDAVTGYILGAAAAVTSANGQLGNITVNGNQIESLTIYTPTTPGPGIAQEFLKVSMPEPSYPTVLFLDLLAGAGVLFAFRRRIAAKVS